MKKALLLNGSPKKNGNTACALLAVEAGLKQAGYATQIVNVSELKLLGCINCDGCRSNGGKCVRPDDTVKLMDAISEAELLIFGSPVYWWGITGQLKIAVDKLYSREPELAEQHKRIGIIAVGAAGLDDPEFKLISDQFKCIADFIGWQLVLDESISAAAHTDLAGNAAKLAELTAKASEI